MVQATGLAGVSLLLTMMVTPSGAAEQRFACKGQVVQEMTNPAVQPKPIDLKVTLGDKNKLSMTTGDGKMLAPRITSNNKIQLKFATKEFVGEYFHEGQITRRQREPAPARRAMMTILRQGTRFDATFTLTSALCAPVWRI